MPPSQVTGLAVFAPPDPMTQIELELNRTKFPVPKIPLFHFFDHFLDAKRYTVQSHVQVALLRQFGQCLATNTKATVTTDKVAALSILADEFCIPALRDECPASDRTSSWPAGFLD
jgi:hypothetical protein